MLLASWTYETNQQRKLRNKPKFLPMKLVRKVYDKAFKEKAVQLSERINNSELARKVVI